MTCNSRCWFAKTDEDKCQCSCGGENHGKGYPKEDKKDPNKDYYYLCEYSFVPYPHGEKNQRFALGADVYARIPYTAIKKWKEEQHALAIWQDRTTKEWVVRKELCNTNIMSFANGIMISQDSKQKFREVYRGDNFQEALNICTILAHKFWGSNTEWRACDHSEMMFHCCKPKEEK